MKCKANTGARFQTDRFCQFGLFFKIPEETRDAIMKQETEINGKTIHYEYDDYQDAIFVSFDKEPPLSYYEELENGVMVRREADTDRIIGFTVRNVSRKVFEQYSSILSPE